MTVYLVILEDRHTDVQIEAFADSADAIRRANAIVADYKYTDPEPFLPAGWLFNAALSGEGDYVSVRKVEVK